MATYVIGDVQGCYDSLMRLLDKINFNDKKDKLLFCGDLVNRGNKSLKTLRFIKNLKKAAISVLGNHDIHCLVVANKIRKPGKGDTLNKIYKAPDRDELLYYLRNLPILHQENEKNTIIVHAGIYPFWSLKEAFLYAKEAQTALTSCNHKDFLQKIYGNKPDVWQNNLTGYKRLRFIINSFTRMRYVSKDGKLDFKYHCPPGLQKKGLFPWYDLTKLRKKQIITGHWATLNGHVSNNITIIDTGCVWGEKLTALQIKNNKENVWHSISC
jgi:bis(5'-nucleosyl)-tetraphosphatase (symmetrical)